MTPVLSTPVSPRQTATALSIGSVALLMLGLQPILLGELVTTHTATMEGVGIIAMSEITALGLGVALGNAMLPLARYRLITVLTAIAAGVLDAATIGATGDGELAAIRALAGLAEGVLIWVATGIIVRSRMPDRLAAIFVVVQTLSQSAAAAALALWIVPRGGWQGGFQALALITLLPAALALWLPPRLTPLRAAAAGRFIWSASAILPLAIAFIQMAAIGSLWAYMEPLGLSKGLDAQGAQTLISETLFMQVFGGIAAVLASAAGVIYLLPAGDTSTFALLCAAFGFTWLFLMPFHVALAFRADSGGNVALLVPAAQLLGSAFGPLMASLMIAGDDASPVPLVSAAFAIAAAIFLSGVRLRRAASSV